MTAAMPNVTVSAVTLTGNKHKGRGIPCEDYSLAVQRDGVSVVVVCDGAGSKQYTHARYGSKSACEIVSELLISYFDALYYENREAAVKQIIISSIHIAFANIMEKYKLDTLERLSCTLMFCAVKDRRVLIGHLGDGLIACSTPSSVRPVTMPQNDKAGHTYFVTIPHSADYMRLVKTTTDGIHGIALMTDGVQDNVYDEASGLVKPVVARMIDTALKGREQSQKEIEAILAQYVVGASNMSDDSSFGILLFEGTAGPDPETLPKSADKFGNSDDSFKELTVSMAPEVKKAQEMIKNCASNPAPSADVPGDDEDYNAVAKASPVPPKPVRTVQSEPAVSEAKPSEPGSSAPKKSAGSSLLLKAVALAELIAIILLLIKIFILGK